MMLGLCIRLRVLLALGLLILEIVGLKLVGAPGGGGASAGGSVGADAGNAPCDLAPGALVGAPTKGATTYSGTGTTTVSNVVFDGSHSDDLVRVYNGRVIFDHVTFRGTGTGSTGHSLEVKQGGSVEVRNSKFEGAPSEDHIQFEFNKDSLVFCNRFTTTPGEDHIDTKDGAKVRIEANTFASPTPGQSCILNHNGTGAVETVSNSGLGGIFYYAGATGSIVGNQISGHLWLYDVTNVLVQGNQISLVKHGESSTTRHPVATYFLNNVIAAAQNNGGTCYRDGNSGTAPVTFCTAGPPSWYSP